MADREIIEMIIERWEEEIEQIHIWYQGELIHSPVVPLTRQIPTREGFLEEEDTEGFDIDRDEIVAYHLALPQYQINIMAWDFVEHHFDEDMISQTLLPMLIMLPITLIALYWSIGLILAPLIQLQRDIKRRSPDNLNSIDLDVLPAELHPVIAATNDLFIRVQGLLNKHEQALERERRFTTNAAHELLTPLAAIKSEVQLFIKQMPGQVDGAALGEIVVRVDRANHTIEQLVTLARLDPSKDLSAQFQPLSLGRIVQELAAGQGKRLEHKSLDFELMVASEVTLQGAPIPIKVMCRNLLDNAIKYCPVGGEIRCSVTDQPEGLVLTVENDGRALPDYLKEYIFEPFVRGPGETESGSGLGLSIVRQVCQLHGARVALSEREDGLGVKIEVIFPPP
ncbi:MAG: ATP-binding protein [Candidatus Competibacterales bacterium]